MDNETMTVEVAYALPRNQIIIPIKMPLNATIEQAIQTSGILNKFPEIDLAVNKIGVFGKLSKLDASLRHLDRVEIYRALIADPKEVRKQRAADGKVMRKGGGDVLADN
ncbi:MAG: RnfH family protein [Methylotenera sp.]|nr:RnfH family protein [Methylotenera sp.]OQW68172.1 MAG: RnfH family protein [Proteobacteria bacterium ST_bin12]